MLIRIRRPATGARLLELPKEHTQDQAELLAHRLRKAFEGVAEVVHPTKTGHSVSPGWTILPLPLRLRRPWLMQGVARSLR
ncbi:jg3224 [Pararge aegeria aegeria]|uniref:Jg3224 protein n=1 Tax=Pararge aegeria aegeria TaxID=348720 RepID=A0A8S4QUF5_9NEOP|nr:jg3224 [Pararge aegeria aegeria]